MSVSPSITNNAIGVVDPNGTYRILYQDESLSWTDGCEFGPDNHIDVTVNQLQRSPGENISRSTIYYDALHR